MSDSGPMTAPNGKRGTAPREWPNTIAAAAQTGLTRKQLEKLAERGALKCEKDTGGVWRWDPDLLAIVGEARSDDDDDDTGTSKGTRSNVLAEAVALLKQSQAHQEQTLGMVRDPMTKLLDRALSDNDELRKRVKQLEEKHDQLIEAREKLLSEQHLRDMLSHDQALAHARKDKALGMVKDALPQLLKAINPKATVVVELVQSLTKEQRDMLLLTDLLNAEQKQQFKDLIGDELRDERRDAPTTPAPPPPDEDEASNVG